MLKRKMHTTYEVRAWEVRAVLDLRGSILGQTSFQYSSNSDIWKTEKAQT